MPYGGINMAEESGKNYCYEPNPELHKIFTEYHKTHNQGVFDAYTPEMRKEMCIRDRDLTRQWAKKVKREASALLAIQHLYIQELQELQILHTT